MTRTSKSKKPCYLSRRHLWIERLEQRSLLAVASFYIDFFEDAGGVPGEPITDSTVEVGQSFFVELRAREHDPGASGLAGVSLDIAWDAPLLEVVEPFDPSEAVTPNLPLFVRGTLHQEGPAVLPFLYNNQVRQDVGHIEGLGGLSFSAFGVGHPIGSNGDDRFVKEAMRGLSTTDDHFAWLHFRAEQPGEGILTMRQGGLRIATLPVSSLSSAQLDFEVKTLTIVEQSDMLSVEQSNQAVGTAVNADVVAPAAELVTPSEPQIASAPRIEVVNSGAHIQFTTDIGSTAGASALVRPALPDDDKSIDVFNSGDAPLTITDIRINVPDVTVAGGVSPIVMQPGETKKLALTYAPSTPNASDATVQSFDIADGIVILSDAVNAPVLAFGLRGDSTFDADTNYDGQVDLADLISFDRNFGLQAGDGTYRVETDPNGDGVIDLADLRSFAAHFHLSRDVPVVGVVQALASPTAEGEGYVANALLSNACAVAPEQHTNSPLLPHDDSRSEPQTIVRSTSFVGPVLPDEYATHLIFAEPANQLASHANRNQLNDELVDVLATDVDSQYRPLAL